MPTSRNKIRPQILIVDDDEQILELLKRLFDRNGIESWTSTSAREALCLIEAAPTIKLALIDIRMPEMDGIELLERMRRITPSVQGIIITGLDDIEAAKKCMELGAKDYITKPFDLDYLQTSVMSTIIPLL